MISLHVDRYGQVAGSRTIRLVRGDRLRLELVWQDDCRTVNRPWEYVRFAASADGDFTGTLLVDCREWTDGVNEYGKRSSRGTLRLDKGLLESAIGDRYEVVLQAELQFEDGDRGDVVTSQRLTLVVRNDVIKGYESDAPEEDYTDGVGTLHTFLCNPSGRDFVGRLVPDGSKWPIADYPALYDKVRSFAKVESNNLEFTIPTIHNYGGNAGLFLRGANKDHPVGRKQSDAMQRISGSVSAVLMSADGRYDRYGAIYLSNGYNYGNSAVANVYGPINCAHMHFDSGESNHARVADETRPVNVAVWWLIQYCTDQERERLLKVYEEAQNIKEEAL